MSVYAAIEAGGTKFVCGVASGPHEMLERITIPTSTPDATLPECIRFFDDAFARHGAPAAFGIGSFGALDPLPESQWYGYIRETPKTDWVNVDMAGAFSRQYGVPVGFDTDVNAAAIAEHRFGAGRSAGIRGTGQSPGGAGSHSAGTGVASLVYITVGTGIGGGAVADGHIVHGLLHPEMGHIPVPRVAGDTGFAGICPYHGDCLEGLASGPAIQKRWGVPATQLPHDHAAWEIEAGYLASLVVVLTGILSPEVIVLGGGVMHVTGLVDRVRRQVLARMNGYFPPSWDHDRGKKAVASASDDAMKRYIVPPVLGDNAGLTGAVALAMDAANGA